MSVSFRSHDETGTTACPTQLFDYVAGGLAIVTSDGQPANRIVTDSATGVVYTAREFGVLVAGVAGLINPAVRASCGAYGRAAFEQRYNCEIDTARALVSLEAVEMRKKRPA